MPLYAYECKDCGVRFDRRQGFDDPPITVCPECEGRVQRLISPAGIVFKGSGFYVTDHKGSSTASAASGNKGESKTDGKSESKPESKSDTTAKAEKSKAVSTSAEKA